MRLPNLVNNLIIIALSTLLALYMCEIYLAYKYSKFDLNFLYKIKNYKQMTGKKYDVRSKYEIYNDYLSKGKKVTLTAPPYTYKKEKKIYKLLGGVSNILTINCNENGYYAKYISDRYGFNNLDKNWDDERIEFLLVGDSFAHGDCVNRPHDISSVLTKISKKTSLTLGYGGSGPLLQYATLREYIQPNIKNIIWLYYEGNDFSELESELKSKILLNYFKNKNFTQKLKLNQNIIDKQIEEEITVEKERKEKDLLKQIKNKKLKIFKMHHLKKFIKFSISYDVPGVISNYKNENHELNIQKKLQPEFKTILRLTKELTQKNQSKLYFVYLPSISRFRYNYDGKALDEIKKIVIDLDIPFINITTEVFKKEKDPFNLFPFRQNGHYTINAYKKIADTIYVNTQ